MFNLLNNAPLYQTFIAVAESSTLLEAADKLKTSQATVSLRLKRFQSLFSFPVFEKKGRKIVILPQGLALKESMKASLTDFQSSLSTFQLERNHAVLKPLKVGARQELYLKLNTKFNPKVPLELISMRSIQIQSALLKSEIDVAISHLKPNNLDFIALPLFLDSFVLCVSQSLMRNHSWPPQNPKDWKRFLTDTPALCYGSESKILSQLFKGHQADFAMLKPTVICEDWSVLRNFLVGGLGYGVFPTTFVKGLDRSILKMNIPVKVCKPLQFYYLYKKEFRNNPQLKALGTSLQKALA